LLEYLIKNGSERVVDYARTNLDIINMLQHFQYLSSDGHDQGANVRNRAKELTNMLSDVNKIRSERKLAKTRRERTGNHSRGFGSMSGISYDSSGFSGSHGYDTDIRRNSIHGGFGGYSGGVYGDGGGFEDSSSRYDSNLEHPPGGFQEYEVEIPEVENANSYVPSLGRSNTARVTRTSSYKKTPPPPPPAQKQVDLFSFDDVQPVAPQNLATSSNNHESISSAPDQDDEFDDFQSAETAVPNTQQPAATTSHKTADSILDLFNTPAPNTFNVNTMPSYNSPITPIASNRPLSMMNFNTPPAASTTRPPGANYGHNRSFSTAPTTGNYGFSDGATIGNGNSSSSAAKKDDVFSSIWTSTKIKSSEAGSTSRPAAPQESLI
jgi:epsin